MTRSLPVALAAAALLLAAPPAHAKEVTAMRVCGADGCRTVTDGLPGEGAVFSGGGPVDPPKRAAWYSIRVTIDTGEEQREGWRMAYVPARRMLRQPGQNPGEQAWFRMSGRQIRAFERLVRGVRPYPAARLRLGDKPEPATALPPETTMITTPPATELQRAGDGGAGVVWWIGGGGLALLLAAGAWLRTRRST